MRGPRVHSFSLVLKERRESRIFGLRFSQYSNSYKKWGKKGERERERVHLVMFMNRRTTSIITSIQNYHSNLFESLANTLGLQNRAYN